MEKNYTIRRLDTRKDLLPAADLIELCFAEHLDQDGKKYLEQIRKAGRNKAYVRWMKVPGERISYPLSGFVWEEDGRIAGNLSMIPFFWRKKWRFLIANVAVHPDFRRRGIARKLTQTALDHLGKLNHQSVWLHVRQDNDAAVTLYRSLNFKAMAVRNTWMHMNHMPKIFLSEELLFRKRKLSDCESQIKWLKQAYPQEVQWYLDFTENKFKPGLIGLLTQFLRDTTLQHWAVKKSGRLMGVASWEPSRIQFADTIWLASAQNAEEEIIPYLLTNLCRRLRYLNKPMMVNYPANRAETAFEEAGFEKLNTLIWMKADL